MRVAAEEAAVAGLAMSARLPAEPDVWCEGECGVRRGAENVWSGPRSVWSATAVRAGSELFRPVPPCGRGRDGNGGLSGHIAKHNLPPQSC
jgi:hypothetical protein